MTAGMTKRAASWAGRIGQHAAAVAFVAAAASAPALASTSGVVISQVYGGNGNVFASDFVELFNAGTQPVALTGWSIQYASATGAGTFASNGVVAVSGTLQPGQHHLVRLATTAGPALPAADSTGSINLSATAGKVVLVDIATGLGCNGSAAQPCLAADLAHVVDLVGYGSANFFEGAAAAPAASSANAVLRAGNGCADTGQNGADFATGVPTPRNSASPAAPCGGGGGSAPIVATCPTSLAVLAGAALDFPLAAADSDNLVDSAAWQSGNVAGMSLTGFVASPAAGASARVRLSFDATVAAGSYPLVVAFGSDGGQSATCAINLSVLASVPAFTPIYTIQGSGATSSLVGTRTTRGVVTKVNNNGYFLQDPFGDGDPATSDGIFVFTGGAPFVEAGRLVQISGTVSEFNTGAAGNATTLANPVTEFGNLTTTSFLGSGSVAATVITLPVAAAGDLERYEGMLVRIESTLTASQNFFQGRYGQVTLAAGGRLIKPTNVFRPGSAQAIALQDENRRRSIMLDDGSSQQNPNPTPYIGADNTLRAGDTLSSVTGVIDYGLAGSDNLGLAMYRIHPTVAPVFTRSNPRTTLPPAVGGNVKVASLNVLNFFTTFGDGTTAAGGSGAGCAPSNSTADCRGADNAAEFLRQRAKIVQAMAAIGADVFGLMEIQNNGNVAAQNLVDALNAVVGAGTYAVVPLPPTTGTDAIRVAMVYKPATLSLVGAAASDADPIHNRPPHAQAFSAAGGGRFSVVVNHFKSKGSCPASGVDADAGDGQGCWNDRRKRQSQALLAFIASIQSAAADSDVIAIGDLNAYGAEDPIDVLTTAGLVDQLTRFNGSNDYSYIFDGESGRLDHALATPGLSAQIAGAVHWHIDADEPSIIDYNAEFKQPACPTCGPDYYTATPYRASDHDPVIVGLNLTGPPAAQTITFAALADRALASSPFTVTASASSGLIVTFSATTPAVCSVTAAGLVSLAATGVCTINANQPGDGNYLAAPTVARSITVTATLQAQTIAFATLADRALGSGSFTVVATASSGLAVAFTSLTPSACSVTAASVALLAAGTCTIAADQPGDAGFAPAPQVARSFQVTPAGAAGSEDIPTLPEWAAILLGLSLLAMAQRRRPRRR